MNNDGSRSDAPGADTSAVDAPGTADRPLTDAGIGTDGGACTWTVPNPVNPAVTIQQPNCFEVDLTQGGVTLPAGKTRDTRFTAYGTLPLFANRAGVYTGTCRNPGAVLGQLSVVLNADSTRGPTDMMMYVTNTTANPVSRITIAYGNPSAPVTSSVATLTKIGEDFSTGASNARWSVSTPGQTGCSITTGAAGQMTCGYPAVMTYTGAGASATPTMIVGRKFFAVIQAGDGDLVRSTDEVNWRSGSAVTTGITVRTSGTSAMILKPASDMGGSSVLYGALPRPNTPHIVDITIAPSMGGTLTAVAQTIVSGQPRTVVLQTMPPTLPVGTAQIPPRVGEKSAGGSTTYRVVGETDVDVSQSGYGITFQACGGSPKRAPERVLVGPNGLMEEGIRTIKPEY
ncbi:hypothetical protein HZC07_01360 [Candidatus Micrarchaeota archaeon]|nr:hypothetical protein [Candidatus Micrarchaeota archaeon]